ncbi:IclR family transcriptional regulator [Stella humosa]|uniref:IclR family transcriptional regulator n=1 Tax=Stella humosa TaxID=94 RepID=A0A3N1KLD6_9PROT|nr:helix-turn-helix domain-containing protein [Stella humosa]ROP81204.1 IclR family transcriptional regulator [Stella humosa]BBK32551.1 transcriptional regulator [Stella humosa]
MRPRSPAPDSTPGVETVVDAAPMRPSVVKSAARVLEIIEFFDEVRREAQVGEIANRLGYPQSSTSVLLKTLVKLGYLDYDGATRNFLPTARVALLGSWLDQGPIREGSLIRMIEELSRTTADTVILAARNGIYSQYIHVVQARTTMRFHVPQGSRRLVVWSATGYALLERAEDDLVGALVRRTNSEVAPQPLIDRRQVLENVRQVRQHGYFFSRGLVTPGAGSIAVPLPLGIERRDRPLTIAVSGLLDDFTRREGQIVAAIRDAVQRFIGLEKP